MTPQFPPSEAVSLPGFSVKLFFLSLFSATLLPAPALFGLVQLAYRLFGIGNMRGLEDLTLIGPLRLSIVLGIALAIGLLVFLAGKKGGAKLALPRRPPQRLAPLLLLPLSAPCLILADQYIRLHIQDNPFAAARDMTMYAGGWGLLLLGWQLLFCWGFWRGMRGRVETPITV